MFICFFFSVYTTNVCHKEENPKSIFSGWKLRRHQRPGPGAEQQQQRKAQGLQHIHQEHPSHCHQVPSYLYQFIIHFWALFSLYTVARGSFNIFPGLHPVFRSCSIIFGTPRGCMRGII